MRSRSHERGQGLGSYLPLAYLALAAVLVTVVLPTSLRPPNQEPNASAELSPDAPPDENAEAIVAALNRGTSGTAGEGAGVGGVSDAEGLGGGTAVGSPPPPVAPSGCPSGFGEPARQVESPYAAPCAPAWQGDNGGATWKGVAAGEVRVAQMQVDGSDGSQGNPGYVADTPTSEQSEEDRVWSVYQAYFNRSFQFWGRYLRFVIHPTGRTEEEQRSAVAEADEQYRIFAAYGNGTGTLEELARRGLVGVGGIQLDTEVLRKNRPHLYSWFIDGETLARHNVEYICKKLAGKPAAHAGDPTFREQPRKFGFIIRSQSEYGSTGIERVLPDLLESECGITDASFVVGDFMDESITTAVTRFRLEGVTTVGLFTDAIQPGPITQTADANGYHPEWLITGMWDTDCVECPVLFNYSKNQWRHAFGLSPKEFVRSPEQQDWFRAYKSVDPDNNPPYWGAHIFYPMLQIANGIQMAGPDLNPTTFEQGLFRMGKRFYPDKVAVGGGYAPDDYSYVDDIAEIWWDPTAPNPSYDGPVGSYRYVRCGARARLGDHLREDTRAFSDGCLTPAS